MKIQEGTLLLASTDLGAGYFRDALILVVVYNKNGAFGLILNRGAKMPINEVFHPVPETSVTSRTFFIGGPVDEESLHILALRKEESGGYPFADGVELGGDWEEISELLETSEEECLLFLGYSGWDAGQLEEEVEEGSWELYNGIDINGLLGDVRSPGSAVDRVAIEALLKKHKK